MPEKAPDAHGAPARDSTEVSQGRKLPAAAQRALQEAEARRAAAKAQAQAAKEFGGRDGPEPARYGDWELKGRAIDF